LYAKKAQANAVVVRKALWSRDEVLAALPYYARWLARQRTAQDKLIDEALGLCKKVHQLDELVQQPDPTKIDDLRKLAPAVQLKAKAIEDACKSSYKQYLAAPHPSALQSSWHAIEDLLVVPFIDPDDRMRLLQNSREISWELNTQAKSNLKGMSAKQNE